MSVPAYRERETILSALLRQAYWLSVAYLTLGIAVTAAQRLSPSDRWLRTSLVLDGISHAALDGVGAWGPLVEGVREGSVPHWAARALVAAVTVTVIHLLALSLALLMSGLRSVLLRWARS